MTSYRCPICNNFDMSDITGKPHRCPPAWRVWISDPGWNDSPEEGKVIRAPHIRSAVEIFAELHDNNGDYDIINGHELRISAAPEDNWSQVETYVVEGQMVPEYFAKLQV